MKQYYVNFFIKLTMKKNIVDIKLMDKPPFSDYHFKKGSYNSYSYN